MFHRKNILLIIMLNVGVLQAQYTEIPGYCFENLLITLGIDSEGIYDGRVLTADIENVRCLDMRYVYECNLSDPTGIEYFVNLECLTVGASVTTIDLSNNTHLKVVTARSNYLLEHINLTNCSELTQLDISNSQLFNIDLSTNINLEILTMNHNENLINLDLSANIKLRKLRIYDNNLSDVIFPNDRSNLLELYIGRNNLTELDVNSFVNIEKLDCSYNLLTHLNISNLVNLTHFYANSNLINNVIFFNLPNLKKIGLRNNDLAEIDLTNLNNIDAINIGNNQLSELNVSNNLMLNSLSCSENQINYLDLNPLLLLSRIDCSSNNLMELRVQNGNNSLLNGTYSSLFNGNPIEVPRFIATNNPNLTCVFVDNIQNSQENWTEIDTTTTFVETEAECEVLAITIFLLNNISVYPNPTTNTFKIETTQNIKKVEIYSVLGKLVQTYSKQTVYDISHLSNGVYSVVVDNAFHTVLVKK